MRKESIFQKIVDTINVFVVHNQFYVSNLVMAAVFVDIKRPVRLWDFCFLFPDVLLFVGLSLLLLRASLRIREINKSSLIVKNKPIELLNTHFRAAHILLTGSGQFARSVVRLLWVTLFFLLANPMGWLWQKYMCYGLLMTSPFIVFTKVIIVGVSIICIKSNYVYFAQAQNRSMDFPVLLGFITFVLLLLVQVHDFFLLFLLFELLAIIFYVVLAVRRAGIVITYLPKVNLMTRYKKAAVVVGAHNNQMISGVTASLTYLLANIFITGIYLFGFSCLFLVCKGTVFTEVAFALTRAILNPEHFVVVLAVFGVLVVFLFKLAAVPFQWWIPAVFEGAPYVTLMFLAVPVKIAIILVLMKILQGVFFCMVWFWQPLLVITSLLSMIVGACALVLQSNLKKFWAYSTINHMGYILLGLSTDTFIGLRAVIIYLVGYVLMNLCFFVIMVALSNDAMQQRILVINQFALLPRMRYSLVSFFFAVLVFSLIGVPPFLGFWGKYFVLMAASSAYTGSILIIILVVALSTTLITTAGYLKIWRSIYMEQSKAAHTLQDVQPIPIYNLRMAFRIIFLLCFGAIFAGAFLDRFYDFLDVFIWGFIEVVPFGEYGGELEMFVLCSLGAHKGSKQKKIDVSNINYALIRCGGRSRTMFILAKIKRLLGMGPPPQSQFNRLQHQEARAAELTERVLQRMPARQQLALGQRPLFGSLTYMPPAVPSVAALSPATLPAFVHIHQKPAGNFLLMRRMSRLCFSTSGVGYLVVCR